VFDVMQSRLISYLGDYGTSNKVSATTAPISIQTLAAVSSNRQDGDAVMCYLLLFILERINGQKVCTTGSVQI
jgi:hypothetical protein